MGSLSDLIKNNKSEPVKKEQPQEIIISQSIIKRVYDKFQEPIIHCPLELLECDITHNFDTTTHKMLNGKFGECLLLGKSAKGDIVLDLPKHKKTLEPLTDEINIRQQAVLAQKVLIKNQIHVAKFINTQVPVCCKVEEGVILQTELDIFPTIMWHENSVRLACVDIKFSSDINSTFGDYSWQNLDFMDHIQPDSIFWLMDHLDLDLCRKRNPEFEATVGYDNIFSEQVLKHLNKLAFIYFVIGYKRVSIDDIQMFERLKYEKIGTDNDGQPIYSKARQTEFYERMRKAIELLKVYYAKGFIPIPYNDVKRFRGCHKCPVNIANKSELNPKAYCEMASKIRSC